jgi:ribokinase
MRVAVVGHVEWVDFVRVERLPAPGEIVHAMEAWAEPAGGGGVASVVLSALAGECLLMTALGDDELGRRSAVELQGHGVRVEAAIRPEPQRRAVTHVDDTGERSITLLSHKLVPRKDDPLPWPELARYDAVYFTGGDPAALRAARAARVLVATARELPTLVEAEVQLDALVRSGRDPGETYEEGWLDPPPRIDVATEGSEGGLVTESGEARRYAAAPLPAPVSDMYGAGDSFAAGLTYGLGAGLSLQDTLELAARCAALALTRRGAYGGPLRPESGV